MAACLGCIVCDYVDAMTRSGDMIQNADAAGGAVHGECSW
jgi:hypothetical protein